VLFDDAFFNQDVHDAMYGGTREAGCLNHVGERRTAFPACSKNTQDVESAADALCALSLFALLLSGLSRPGLCRPGLSWLELSWRELSWPGSPVAKMRGFSHAAFTQRMSTSWTEKAHWGRHVKLRGQMITAR
jgi:hypothetical protein